MFLEKVEELKKLNSSLANFLAELNVFSDEKQSASKDVMPALTISRSLN